MNEPAKLGWHSLGTTFDCACGMTHSLPIKECYVGPDAVARLATYARNHCGKRGLIVADENTRATTGDALYRGLHDAGKDITEVVYGAEPLDATDELGNEVADAAFGSDFIVGVGSGSLSDLAKYAGNELNRPVLLFPTAASMNGYTSAIVALKVRGLKRTIPCKPAEGVFADPAISATAPQRMTAAGVADFLSKCSSSTDWQAAHLLHGVYYCDRPREFFEGTQQRLLDACPAIGRGEPEAIGIALECLMLSGCSMVVAGSSAPASGGEHLISHYLDMKSALNGTPHDLHGTQVGVATIYCLELWEKILTLAPSSIDIDARIAALPNPEDVAATIDQDWGSIALEVHDQWNQKMPTPESLRAELQAFKNLTEAQRNDLAKELLPASTVAQAIQACGGPTRPEDLTAPLDEYQNALTRARYIRNRFTVLDLAADLGI
jgi:glycerol-1-phosphate dehydrogenase [NAD(P)+]